MISSFITVISVLIIMICLSVFPGKSQEDSVNDPLNGVSGQELVQDFEKALQQKTIVESFSSLSSNQVDTTNAAQAPAGWNIYKQGPFNNWSTYPSSKPVFYEKKVYRQPYRWPYTYTSSYPVKHQSNLDLKS